MSATTTKEQAYRALYNAAEQVGDRAGRDPKNYRRVGRKVQFVPSEYHKSLVTAMGDVMAERITVEEACSLLHTYDHDKERWGK